MVGNSSVFSFRIVMFPLLVYQLAMLKNISMLFPKLPSLFPLAFSRKTYADQFKFVCPYLVWNIWLVVIQMPCIILGFTTIWRIASNHYPGFDNGVVL